MGSEECSVSDGVPKRGRVDTGWVRSAESIIGAPVGIEERPSQAEER
jgi:hypothetical protein